MDSLARPALLLVLLTACDATAPDVDFAAAGAGVVVTVSRFRSPPQNVYAPVLNGLAVKNFEGRVVFSQVGGAFSHTTRRVDIGPSTVSSFSDRNHTESFIVPATFGAGATLTLQVRLIVEDGAHPAASDDLFTGENDVVASGLTRLYPDSLPTESALEFVTNATYDNPLGPAGRPNGSYVIWQARARP
jgi:hypothetical protein